jgi:Zn-dependent protease with chaperone function
MAAALFRRPVSRLLPAALNDHLPAEYEDVHSWLVNSATRDWKALVVAFLVGWGFIPFAICGLFLGAVLGAIAGVMGSSFLIDGLSGLPVLGNAVTTFWAGLGGIAGLLVGALAGAVVGLVLGFCYPLLIVAFAATAGGDTWLQIPLLASLLVLLFLGLGLGYVLWVIGTEGGRQGIGGARRMSHREAQVLVPIVHEMADRLGCRSAPRILVHDDPSVNAYAGAWHVIVTQGLIRLTEEDPEALAGVLAHEVMHWRNGDAVTSMFLRGMALPVYLLYNLSHRLGPAANMFLRLTFGPFTMAMNRAFLPSQAAATRAGEYRGDQAAVLAGVSPGLRRALEAFKEIETGRNGWELAVCASHPPTELRIERLLAAEARHGPVARPDRRDTVDLSRDGAGAVTGALPGEKGGERP